MRKLLFFLGWWWSTLMGAQTLHLPTTSGELQLIGKHSEYLEDQQHHRTWKAIENAPFAPVQEDIALFKLLASISIFYKSSI